MPDNFYFWVEASTLLICMFCCNRFNLTRYKLFLPYLTIIVLYEYGNIHQMFTIHQSNVWIVNFEILLEYIFYSYFIISTYKKGREKNLLMLISLVILLFTFADIFMIQGIMALCTIAIMLQYGFLITMVCRFFFRQMQEVDQSSSLLQQPDFWVHTGLLFFFLAEFLFFASFSGMAYKNIANYRLLFVVISNVAILILYACLSISFLCFRQTKKISC